MTEINLIDLLIMAGAISWLSTVTVFKTGPFKILEKWRLLNDKIWGGKDRNPFRCPVCSSFYWGIAVIMLYEPSLGLRRVIGVFGIIGLAITLRGMSQEFS